MSKLSQDQTKNRKYITMSSHFRLSHCGAEFSSQGAEFSGCRGPSSPGADFSAGPSSPGPTSPRGRLLLIPIYVPYLTGVRLYITWMLWSQPCIMPDLGVPGRGRGSLGWWVSNCNVPQTTYVNRSPHHISINQIISASQIKWPWQLARW